MLTYEQIQHYRTFGFVILRGFITTSNAEALASELHTALDNAHGHTHPGRWLPAMTTATPMSAALVADDARLWQASQELLGDYTIPCPAAVAHLSGGGAWHYDDGIGVVGVRFSAYPDHDYRTGGCLHLLPLSHTTEAEGLRAYVVSHAGGGLTESAGDFPGFMAQTSPGDVIAFDLHTWHAFRGDCERLLWTVDYVAQPVGPAPDLVHRKSLVRTWLADAGEPPAGDYDHEAWPVWRDWVANPDANENRSTAIIRLKVAGAFDVV